MPEWGAFVGPDLYTYGERRTVKARNLTREDRAVVHLESAEVVVVHGRLEDGADPAFDALYRTNPERAALWLQVEYDAWQGRWPGQDPCWSGPPGFMSNLT